MGENDPFLHSTHSPARNRKKKAKAIMSPTVMLQLVFCIWQQLTVLTMMGIGIHVEPGCEDKLPDDTNTMDAEEFIANDTTTVTTTAFLVCTVAYCHLFSTRVERKLSLA